MNADTQHPLALDEPRFRLADGRTRPEFMLVGAAKCGSTSFAKYLSTHPQVKTPNPASWSERVRKEPNYWSWLRFPAAKYQRLFVNESPLLNPRPDQFVSGEYSTSSLIHPLVPRRVLANLPKIKIFVLLRNPIDRAYSHFTMFKKSGREQHCAFEDIIHREIDEVAEMLAAHQRGFLSSYSDCKSWYSSIDTAPIQVIKHEQNWPTRSIIHDSDLRDFYFQSYVFRSLYHDQLHRWLRLFPRHQLMIIQSEKFFAHPVDTMNKAAEFLGLSPFEFQATDELQRGWDAGSSETFERPKEYQPMADSTRRILADFFAPYNQQLYSLIDEDFGWH